MAIKWVGGKTRVVPILASVLPSQIQGHWIEPFCGGGSCAGLGNKISDGRMFLSDRCADLIELYLLLRQDPKIGKVRQLLMFDKTLTVSDRASYERLNAINPDRMSVEWRVARFVRLVYSSFNGKLNWNKGYVRANAIGFQEDRVSWDALETLGQNIQKAAIRCIPWQEALEPHPVMCEGSVVYLDPPYLPTDEGKGERPYSGAAWNVDNLASLICRAYEMRDAGAMVVLSEHDSQVVRALLGKRWQITRFNIGRTMGGHTGEVPQRKELIAVLK